MTTSFDTLRAANILLEQYGEEAKNHAHAMLEKFALRGDMKEAGTWLAVLHDMEMLTDSTRQGGSIH